MHNLWAMSRPTRSAVPLAFLLAAVLPVSRLGAQGQSVEVRIDVPGIGQAGATGLYHFKFAIVDGAGAETYWSHDGTSSGGERAGTAVPCTSKGRRGGRSANPVQRPAAAAAGAAPEPRTSCCGCGSRTAAARLPPPARPATARHRLRLRRRAGAQHRAPRGPAAPPTSRARARCGGTRSATPTRPPAASPGGRLYTRRATSAPGASSTCTSTCPRRGGPR